MDDDITRRDLKGYQGGLEHEEVPPGGKSKGFVNVATSKANERAGDGQVCDLSGNHQ